MATVDTSTPTRQPDALVARVERLIELSEQIPDPGRASCSAI